MDNAIQYLHLNELIPGEFHPHSENNKDNLSSLTSSIKKYGILEPLIVRPKNKKYEIILGNRRYKAANNLGIEKVPVIILNLDDSKALELIISDNVQRKELTPKEEATLYAQALSYPNNSKENLSINLGIPLDRINSKLNLLQKKEPQKEVSQINKIQSYNNHNNSVNNDIINLSELNKEEKEREDFNMNNNQFNNNNNMNNNTTNNQEIPTSKPQEPTFGGRFFPSLEDEPTNMNLGMNMNISQPNQQQTNTNISNGPLIDLTDLDNTQIIPTQSLIQTSPVTNTIPTPMDNSINQPMNILQPESIPNSTQPNSIPYENYNSPTPQTPPVELNVPPVPEIQVPSINLTEIQQQTPLVTNNNINDFAVPNNDIPQSQVVSYESNPEQVISQTTNMEQPKESIPQNSIDINSIPNLNNNYSNTTTVTNEPKKDIIPVVNMIKNLAISIESLGYKLDIDEDDSDASYKITIEVEK